MANTKTAAKEKALVTSNMPAAFDYGTDAGSGYEGTNSGDLIIPFFNILQALSPQVAEETLEGAKAGLIHNSVTDELWAGEEGIVIQPVHKEHVFAEWVPIDDGGGFVGLHDPESDLVAEAIKANDGSKYGSLKNPDNNHDLVETYYLYMMQLCADGEESLGFGVTAITSTKIKHFKKFLTSLYTLKGRPPFWANRARMCTFKDKRDKHTFFNIQFKPFGNTWRDGLINPATQAALLEGAKGFREMVLEGTAKANYDQQNGGAGGNADADGSSIPF